MRCEPEIGPAREELGERGTREKPAYRPGCPGGGDSSRMGEWKDTRGGRTLGKFGENELRSTRDVYRGILWRDIDGRMVDGSWWEDIFDVAVEMFGKDEIKYSGKEVFEISITEFIR